MPEVKLKQPHTHQGKRVAAGEIITVTEAEAVWLREHEIIEVAPVVNDTQGNRGKNKQQEPEDNGTV
ncbi:DUF7210 family protein [Raoultella ornithinolytica]|uniref:DUF7210 family protein n=1 Tax=Raoultella ornithinolytica TaxID=54291 RepID=UPI00292BD166|nr:hypothetical protein [Raoultella ornithinolytica]MDV1101406.1 hypothetical protein [Raoultella ornithinolytica]